MTEIRINGVLRQVTAELDTPLLWVLRDEMNLTGTKFGCGAGLCGACTVHIGGEAMRSCQVSLAELGTSEVTTIEGLGNGDHPVQKAWVAEQVPQCGYCQSGMIMAAAALLARTPNPTDADVEDGITNICRCGTYGRIRAAIRRAANS